MTPDPASQTDRAFLGSVMIIVIVTVALHVAGAFLLKASFWGAHLFGFFHPALLVLSSCAVVLLCVGIAIRGPSLYDRATSRAWVESPLILGFLVVIGVAMFWIFRVRDSYLGDGTILINSVADGQVFHPREPLIMAVQQMTYRALAPLVGRSRDAVSVARDTVAIVSITAGGLFIFVSWHLARALAGLRRGPTVTLEVLLLTLILLSQGYTLLFFGYVENYALYALAIATYMVLALRFARGEGPLLFPALVLCLAIGLHIASIILLPSFAVLAAWGLTVPRKRLGTTRDLLLAGALFLGLHLLLARLQPGLNLIASIREAAGFAVTRQQEHVPMLSWIHVRDFINEQVLIGPLGLLLFIPAMITIWIAKRWRRVAVAFLVTVALGYLAAAWLAGDSNLGYARDWDVWAPAGLTMTVAGLGLFLSVGPSSRGAMTALLCALVLSIYHTAPWIVVNASPTRSLARLKTLPLGMGRTEVLVSQWYRERGDDRERRLWLEKATREYPRNNNAHYLLGIYYEEIGDMKRAAESFRRAVELRPDKVLFHQRLADALIATERYEETIPHFEFELTRDPDNAARWMLFGETLRKAGRADAARIAFEKALPLYQLQLQSDPHDFSSNLACGWLLYNLTRYEEAVPHLRRALESQPRSDSALCLMGYARRALGKEDAVGFFEDCLEINPDRPDRRPIEAWLREVGDPSPPR